MHEGGTPSEEDSTDCSRTWSKPPTRLPPSLTRNGRAKREYGGEGRPNGRVSRLRRRITAREPPSSSCRRTRWAIRGQDRCSSCGAKPPAPRRAHRVQQRLSPLAGGCAAALRAPVRESCGLQQLFPTELRSMEGGIDGCSSPACIATRDPASGSCYRLRVTLID